MGLRFFDFFYHAQKMPSSDHPLVQKVYERARALGSKSLTLMEVCGGHTHTIMEYGIRDILPPNIRLISGPGCPVCVTDQHDVDNFVALARSGVRVATYGDMMRVPGTHGSLDQARADGADVRVVVSALEMLEPENRDRVFLGVGFETTTPPTAYLLERGICVYSTHKVMLPPMRQLIQTTRVDGFLDPGHVSCITGAEIWEELSIPQVITGFGPYQILRGIEKLIQLCLAGENRVINDYPEVVTPQGNQAAKASIKKNFCSSDAYWRGLGQIPGSGLEPRDPALNARIKYRDRLSSENSKSPTGCRCGEILQGQCAPEDCPLFRRVCTPENPIGACMVSQTEGACGIAYRFAEP
jgi:hydrogenase expression/formation protein HypD